MTDKKTMPTWARILIDFGPLVIFFASFKLVDIYVATGTFMAATIVAMIASRILTGHIAPMLMVTFVIVMVMGGLTLYLHDETFVKMKLTIINGLFAAVLLFGLMTGRLYIKMLMELAIEMEEAGWRLFTRNYIIFLIVMAGVNELIWRTQSTDFWVNFKTFGYMGVTMLFIVGQTPVLMKHMREDPEG